MSEVFDAVVIGAGPAGMAAATTLAGRGARTMLLDEQDGPGGQIYRGIAAAPVARRRVLGSDYGRGLALAAALAGGGVDYRPGSAVWHVTPDRDVHFTRGGAVHVVNAATLVLATGAIERPVPVPGWTLPGVFTAGALQILLKASGVASDGAVLAGTGPLLYQLAAQYVAAGVSGLTVLDMSRREDRIASLRLLPAALRGRGPHYLAKGLGMFARLARAGVRVYRNVRELCIEGEGKVEAVRFRHGQQAERLPVATVGLHAGVIPATHIPNALGCRLEWDAAQHCLRPSRDEWGESSIGGIWIAGDGGGIGGARAAEHAGRLAALAALTRLGRLDATGRDRLAVAARRGLAAHGAIRPFLDRRYPPPAEILHPADATILCRCEEITAGQVRAAARQGAQGPNQAKAFLRAGMGPCQGRVCGPAVAEVMAQALGRPVEEIGTYRIRPPFKPLTVGELAASADQPG